MLHVLRATIIQFNTAHHHKRHEGLRRGTRVTSGQSMRAEPRPQHTQSTTSHAAKSSTRKIKQSVILGQIHLASETWAR